MAFRRNIHKMAVVTPRYLKMIHGMKGSGPRNWSLYVLRCGDGSLYTGVAKDVDARFHKHQSGRGAAYTRTHLPVELVYCEGRKTRSQALVREAEIKRMPRHRKEKLIENSPQSAMRRKAASVI